MAHPAVPAPSGFRDDARAVLRRVHALDLSQVSAGVAFWLMIAVFPAGVAVVNVFGLILDQETVAHFVGRFVAATPGSLGDAVALQLHDVAAPSPGTLVPDAILVIVAVWTVSTALSHLVRAIQVAAGAPKRGLVVVRGLAVGLALAAIVGLALLSWVLDATTALGSIAGYVISLVVLTLVTAAIYRTAVGPSASVVRLLPGAGVAASGIVVVGIALDVYGALAPNMRLIYGAVAGLVISMLCVWLGVFSVLIGAVVNARRLATPEEISGAV